MLFKKIFTLIFLSLFSFSVSANTPRSTGKYKNWESFTAETDKGKICFAQTTPTKRAPSSIQRSQSKLFVTFRPNEKISDEISVTPGYEFNKNNSVTAISGKNKVKKFIYASSSSVYGLNKKIPFCPFGLTSQVWIPGKKCLIHSDVMTIVHARSLTVADAVKDRHHQ